MAVDMLKSALCSPSNYPLPDEIGYDATVHARQMVEVNVSRNKLDNCPVLSGNICRKDGTNCLPNKGNFSRVTVLP